jgi:high-affinity nickel-transport protein
MWGLGHSFTVSLFGGAIIAFRLAPSPRVSLVLELLVALMLMLLGTVAMLRRPNAPVTPPPLRPFLVGIVHGLAGSAAAALLILSTINDAKWALAYLAVFSAGTLAGMALITSVFALPSLYQSHRAPGATHWLRATAGALTFAFGCYLAYRIGFVDGLLRDFWR